MTLTPLAPIASVAPATVRQQFVSHMAKHAALANTASLERERELLALALETGRLGVYEWRVGEAEVWWSPETYLVYGVDPSTFSPTVEGLNALVHPDDRAELWRRTTESLESGSVFKHEYRIVLPSGEIRWVLNHSHVDTDAEGRPQRLVGMAADVTDRVVAQLALAAAEERYRLATEAMSGYVYDLDVATDRVERSAGFAEVTGYAPPDTQPTAAWWAERIHPDDWTASLPEMERILSDAACPSHILEYRVRHAAGHWIWISDRQRFVRDADGKVVRVVGGAIDVTARRTAEAAAESARAHAESASRAKSEFLAVMSHELRTPLNAIQGYVELLELGIYGPLTEAQREALGRVRRSEEHLTHLIDQVLNLSRIESGRVEYEMHQVRLADALAEIAAMVEPQLAGRKIVYRAQVPATCVVHADIDKLRQILLNLLGNALKFTPEGGSVDIRCAPLEESSPYVHVLVQDSGIGIAADKLEAIFEPFVQVNASYARAFPGTGLGLTISRDLARGMGGDLQVESVPGEGSTFTLVLRRES